MLMTRSRSRIVVAAARSRRSLVRRCRYAALPTFWQVSTEADFLRGEVENLSIDSLRPPDARPDRRRRSTSRARRSSGRWSTRPDGIGLRRQRQRRPGLPDRRRRQGRACSSTPKSSRCTRSRRRPAAASTSATSPDGKIYKVDASGKGAVFFDPPDRYIWSLAVDRAGNVFAGTGDKGVIYKITPDGKGAPFYQTKATHAMTLAFDREGRLLAGTESPGPRVPASTPPASRSCCSTRATTRSTRCASTRRATSTRPRVSGRAGGGGGAGAAAAARRRSGAGAGGHGVHRDHRDRRRRHQRLGGAGQPSGGRAPTGPGGRRRLPHQRPTAPSDLVWESREDTPYDLAFEAERQRARRHRQQGQDLSAGRRSVQPTLVARANAQQVTTLATDRSGRMLFATSNPGKVFRLSADARGARHLHLRRARRADGGHLGRDQVAGAWRRRARASRSPRARGNTRTPDETWSDWSAAYADREGSADHQPARALSAVARGARPAAAATRRC